MTKFETKKHLNQRAFSYFITNSTLGYYAVKNYTGPVNEDKNNFMVGACWTKKKEQ